MTEVVGGNRVLVGRCPTYGHSIYEDRAVDPPVLVFTCECPGRADGLFAASYGLVPKREVHPTVERTETVSFSHHLPGTTPST